MELVISNVQHVSEPTDGAKDTLDVVTSCADTDIRYLSAASCPITHLSVSSAVCVRHQTSQQQSSSWRTLVLACEMTTSRVCSALSVGSAQCHHGYAAPVNAHLATTVAWQLPHISIPLASHVSPRQAQYLYAMSQ